MARILAVDDSPSMRQMVSIALTGAGYEVEQACDGVEALAIAQKSRFDLVITDVNMPNMDGITLVRELRGKANYKFVPLLVLTTEATPGAQAAGQGGGRHRLAREAVQPRAPARDHRQGARLRRTTRPGRANHEHSHSREPEQSAGGPGRLRPGGRRPADSRHARHGTPRHGPGAGPVSHGVDPDDRATSTSRQSRFNGDTGSERGRSSKASCRSASRACSSTIG